MCQGMTLHSAYERAEVTIILHYYFRLRVIHSDTEYDKIYKMRHATLIRLSIPLYFSNTQIFSFILLSPTLFGKFRTHSMAYLTKKLFRQYTIYTLALFSNCNSLVNYECNSVYPIKYDMGRDNSDDIATRYGLDGLRIEFRCVARFSAPIQTGPAAHPPSNTMGTGSFLG